MTPIRMLFGGGGGPFASRTGTGILTVGAISSIVDDTYYNSWPAVTRADDGRLIALYTKGVAHFGNNNSNPDIAVSFDEAATWSTIDFNIYDHASLKASSIAITTLSTGRIIAGLSRDDQATPGTGEPGIVYSDDNGLTWTGWIDVTNGFTQESFVAGAVLELPGGDLLIPIEGSNSGDPILNRSAHTLRSSDGGDTWGTERTIRNYATDTRPYYETTLLLLDNGELIAIHRTTGGAGTHYISRSSDQGATTGGWGAPSAAFDGYGKPHAIQASTGTLIVVTRRNSDAAAIAYTSIDRGATWSSAYVLDDTMEEMEYGAPIELPDGQILVVYGSQPTSSINDSDIKQVYVTETLA